MSVATVDRARSHIADRARPSVPAGPFLVLGTGNAGRAATEALVARSGPGSVVVFDDATSAEVRRLESSLARRQIAFTSNPARALDGIRCVVKSPGIRMHHPVIAGARDRGLPVLDEFELGWRLSAAPLAAVTGTDGKSTTTSLLVEVMRRAGRDPVLAGNVEGFRGAPAMCEIPRDHDGWVVAEVSSYQAEGSPEFLPEAAVFTNLTHAHLERHGSMDAYGDAKRRLFVRGDRAVGLAAINADDPFGRRLAREVTDRGGRALTFGRAGDADFSVRSCHSRLRGGSLEVVAPDGVIRLESRLPGWHNAANLVAALALAEGLGLPRETTLRALAEARPVPGRFDVIAEGQPFHVIVDFAHSPAAIEQVLATARDVVSGDGRVIAVLGKVTKSDRGYQEAIGRAARSGADNLIVCGSSLRGEPPLMELQGVAAGARRASGGELEVVLDRRKAIRRGFSLARGGDLVAILGRGGRRRMTYDTKGRPGTFDDREVARELLAEMGMSRGG